jgi:hypothetical protein
MLEHYGVKGMTWGSTKQEILDRIYRVESGTSIRRERIKKTRQKKLKDVIKEEPDKDIQKVIPEDKNQSRESLAKNLLGKVGATRFVDLG